MKSPNAAVFEGTAAILLYYIYIGLSQTGSDVTESMNQSVVIDVVAYISGFTRVIWCVTMEMGFYKFGEI